MELREKKVNEILLPNILSFYACFVCLFYFSLLVFVCCCCCCFYLAIVCFVTAILLLFEFRSKIHYLSSFFFRVFVLIFIFFLYFSFSFFLFAYYFVWLFFLSFVTVSLQLVFCLSVATHLALFVYLFVLFAPIFPIILLLVSSIKNISGAPGHPEPKGEPGESISLPAVSVTPPSLTVTQNQTALFYCSAVGNPRPRVSWSKTSGGGLLNMNGRQDMLEIRKTSYNDSGEYVCTATNLLGKVQKFVKLFVEGEIFVLRSSLII